MLEGIRRHVQMFWPPHKDKFEWKVEIIAKKLSENASNMIALKIH